MALFDVATAAHLAGTVILALFFVLLSRHDARPYLRDWTGAWIAQALALSVLLIWSLREWQVSLGLYLFLETAHGLLLAAAAFSYAKDEPSLRLRLLLIGPLAMWSGVGPLLVSTWTLHAMQFAVLALTYVSAAWVLWPLRTTGMGLRMTTNVLGLLGLLYVFHAIVYGSTVRSETTAVRFLEVAPFTVLLLQMLLGLGMVLAVTEAAQWALAATNRQLEEAQHRLKVLAETDPLTGCFNRRVFRELVDVFRGDGDGASGVVMLLDMDGLKAINDARGHTAGDEAIRGLAEAIQGRTRKTDLVVRWGGDEFVVVLPGATREEGETRLAEVLGAAEGQGLAVSAGLAAYGAGCDIMAAVEQADHAMYRVKADRKAVAKEDA